MINIFKLANKMITITEFPLNYTVLHTIPINIVKIMKHCDKDKIEVQLYLVYIMPWASMTEWHNY